MTGRRDWTEQELLIALRLYCELPFGRLHSRNPTIINIADKLGRTPSALAMKLTNLASLDPVVRDAGKKGLSAASALDRAMFSYMQTDWNRFTEASEQALNDIVGVEQMLDEPSSETIQVVAPVGKDVVVTAKARRGQAFFRRSVLSAYNNTCCITGVNDPIFLVASHIIPWRENEEHRLNPTNGICLSTLHDRAFDQGFISFSDHLELIFSDKIRKTENEFLRGNFLRYENKALSFPSKFSPQAEFLAYHRSHIFNQ